MTDDMPPPTEEELEAWLTIYGWQGAYAGGAIRRLIARVRELEAGANEGGDK